MAEDDGSAENPKNPSFHGRLQLKDFMFANSEATAAEGENQGSPLRRSSRITTTRGGGSSPAPIPTSRNQPSRGTPSPVKNTSNENNNKKRAPSKRSSAYFLDDQGSSPSSPSKKRSSSKYAPPSLYAKYPLLPDSISPNLLILFIGLNPGLSTSLCGHAYAHPSNLFYKLLSSSGITPGGVPIPPQEDRTFPERFSLGLTNIVARPTRNGGELKNEELDAGVARLEAKVRRWRPEAVCLVGKGIWESLYRVRHNKTGTKKKKQGKNEFRYGWQGVEENMGVIPGGGEEEKMGEVRRREDEEYEADLRREREAGEEEGDDDDEEEEEKKVKRREQLQQPWGGARVFVATSTSGLAATLKPEEKERIWKELGDWCAVRRKERGDVVG